MSTNAISAKDIKRGWYLVDAKGKVLGRLATEIASILMGKNKASFVPYLDNGDFVVVTNAKAVKVSGKKMTDKIYYHHSLYPGGLKKESFNSLIERKPEEIIRHAVRGMLPKNRLGRKMLTKLHVFEGSKHNFEKQLGVGNG